MYLLMLVIETILHLSICAYTLYDLSTKHHDVAFRFMGNFYKGSYFYASFGFILLAVVSNTKIFIPLWLKRVECSATGILGFLVLMWLALDTTIELKYWVPPIVVSTVILVGFFLVLGSKAIENLNLVGNGYTFKEKRAVSTHIVAFGKKGRKIPHAMPEEIYMNISDLLQDRICDSDLK